MDNRSFITRLAKATETDSRQATALTAAIVDIMAECAAQNDNVAIPGFGTFESVKTLEYVANDTVTGTRTLVPPSISVVFKPGSRLKKSVAKL